MCILCIGLGLGDLRVSEKLCLRLVDKLARETQTHADKYVMTNGVTK